MVAIRLYDRADNPIGELSPEANTLTSCSAVQEINGEHSVTFESPVHIDEGTRAVILKDSKPWGEWVVDEVEESHDTGPHANGRYHMVWSLQYDLQGVHAADVQQPGMADGRGTAKQAMASVLSGTRRWKVGRTDVSTMSAALMAFDSAWDRLNTMVKFWGGNVDVDISYDDVRVTRRELVLLDHQGQRNASRRLEWHHDMTSISRTPDPGPHFCRVIPYGSGDQEYADDGETTFEWKLTVADANGGRIYISDPDAERLFRVAVSDTAADVEQELHILQSAIAAVRNAINMCDVALSNMAVRIADAFSMAKSEVTSMDGATEGFSELADDLDGFFDVARSTIGAYTSEVKGLVEQVGNAYAGIYGITGMVSAVATICDTYSVQATSNISVIGGSITTALRSATGALNAASVNSSITTLENSVSPGAVDCRTDVLDALTGEESHLVERYNAINSADGVWEYPTTAVDYQTDDPEELLVLAREDLHAHTRPGVSYSATVSQFAEAGMIIRDIELGDEVQVVDYGFNEDVPLLIEERVLRIEEDLLGVEDKRLTIGKLSQSLERAMSNIVQAVGESAITAVAPAYVKPSYTISVPERPIYTVQTPDGEVAIPTGTSSFEVPDYSSYLGDLDDRIGAIEGATGINPVDYPASSWDSDDVTPSGGGVSLGERYIHQIDGVEAPDGTVFNFVTKGGGGGSGGGSGQWQGPVLDNWGNSGSPTLYNHLMSEDGFVTPGDEQGHRTAATWGLGGDPDSLADTLIGGAGGFVP